MHAVPPVGQATLMVQEGKEDVSHPSYLSHLDKPSTCMLGVTVRALEALVGTMVEALLVVVPAAVVVVELLICDLH